MSWEPMFHELPVNPLLFCVSAWYRSIAFYSCLEINMNCHKEEHSFICQKYSIVLCDYFCKFTISNLSNSNINSHFFLQLWHEHTFDITAYSRSSQHPCWAQLGRDWRGDPAAGEVMRPRLARTHQPAYPLHQHLGQSSQRTFTKISQSW